MARKKLDFKCPHCGSERLEEVFFGRRELTVIDPENPDYDWYYDFEGCLEGDDFKWIPSEEYPFYRCYTCETCIAEDAALLYWKLKKWQSK